uniref:Uncharacterized protein n=4 Tax=Cercopithecinae TaxID=9528 RepID=A0A2K5KMY2_CERAT|nr:unnamed protein product [Macaca fascicularis]
MNHSTTPIVSYYITYYTNVLKKRNIFKEILKHKKQYRLGTTTGWGGSGESSLN